MKTLQESSTVSAAQAANELLARRKARSNVLDFTRYTFPEYKVNWHHALLCRYLDRFVSGEIKRLMINMPPRHGKSELVSRRLPAYILGRNPKARIIAASYAAELSERFNRDVQRIIDSPEYTRLFPDSSLNTSNVRTVSQGTWLRNASIFEIVGQGGVYRNAGVGGGITGMGFDYGFIDDPFKDAKEANSETIRNAKWEWYVSTFWTRQQKDAGICLTNTRWHMDDMAGRLIERATSGEGEEWVILNLPALMLDIDKKHPEDPRSYGEALWPEEYPESFSRNVELQNKFVFAALYQQAPVPQGAGLFDVSKIKVIDALPSDMQTIRFYDLAATAKKHSDYTAGVKLGIDKQENIYICHVYRVQKTPAALEDDIIANARLDGHGTRIRFEAEKQGLVQLDFLLRKPELRGFIVDGKAPDGDKYTRAQAPASRVNTEKVFMLRGEWNRAFLDELSIFPMGAHDDQVDAFSGAYDALRELKPLPKIASFA